MNKPHAHTEQIESEKLPLYLAAAQNVGNVAVVLVASEGERFFGYSTSSPNSGFQYVMNDHAVVQISAPEGTGDFYREVANLKAQTESN